MSDIKKSICVLILAYNNLDRAVILKRQVAEQDWKNKTIRIIDNGSVKPIKGALRIEENIRYTRGMEFGWNSMKEKSYDAFWFLNSNIYLQRTYILSGLMSNLFLSDDIAQVSPRIIGSDHGFMQWHDTQDMEWIELSAVLVRSAVLDTIGFWETELTYGNMIDIDYCYRLKKSNLRSVLVGDVSVEKISPRKALIHTTEGKAYAHAAIAEACRVMSDKYGPGWRELMAETFGGEDTFVRTIRTFPDIA